MDKKDKQLIFDAGLEAVIAQGGRSTGGGYSGLSCQFRGPGGRKCFVGHFMPDANYKKAHETLSVDEIATIFGWCSPLDGDDFQDIVKFMRECQRAHDMGSTAYTLRCGFQAVAKQYGLDSTLIDSIKIPQCWG